MTAPSQDTAGLTQSQLALLGKLGEGRIIAYSRDGECSQRKAADARERAAKFSHALSILMKSKGGAA